MSRYDQRSFDLGYAHGAHAAYAEVHKRIGELLHANKKNLSVFNMRQKRAVGDALSAFGKEVAEDASAQFNKFQALRENRDGN